MIYPTIPRKYRTLSCGPAILELSSRDIHVLNISIHLIDLSDILRFIHTVITTFRLPQTSPKISAFEELKMSIAPEKRSNFSKVSCANQLRKRVIGFLRFCLRLLWISVTTSSTSWSDLVDISKSSSLGPGFDFPLNSRRTSWYTSLNGFLFHVVSMFSQKKPVLCQVVNVVGIRHDEDSLWNTSGWQQLLHLVSLSGRELKKIFLAS